MIRWSGLSLCLLALPVLADEAKVETPKTEEKETVAMVLNTINNATRKQIGLQPMQLDDDCVKIAQNWANHMASVNSMYHGGGEQICAVGTTSCQSTHNMWMNSGGHQAWMMTSSCDLAGWGCARSANGTYYWAGAFRSSPQHRPIIRAVTAPVRMVVNTGRRIKARRR